MSEGPIRIFDLESKLAADDDGTLRRQITDELAAELQQVKQRMNAGLPPDEFQKVESYAAALEKASAVVEKVWKLEHSK